MRQAIRERSRPRPEVTCFYYPLQPKGVSGYCMDVLETRAFMSRLLLVWPP